MKTDESTSRTAASEKLLEEIHAIAADAERLLGATLEDCTREDSCGLRLRLAAAQKRLAELYAGARDQARKGAQHGDAMVRQHPYEALALALGVGALLGTLLHRGHGHAAAPKRS